MKTVNLLGLLMLACALGGAAGYIIFGRPPEVTIASRQVETAPELERDPIDLPRAQPKRALLEKAQPKFSDEELELLPVTDTAVREKKEPVRKERPKPVDPEEPAAPAGNEEKPAIDPHVEFKPIPDERFNLLMESIFQVEFFDPPDLPVERTNSAPPWQEWKENFYNLAGDVHEVVLRFEDSEEVNLKGDRAPSYVVSVNFEETRVLANRKLYFDRRVEKGGSHYVHANSVVLKHSHPAKKAAEGGYRFGILSKKQQRLFMHGSEHTSIVVAVPQVRSKDARGMLICPRDYDMWKVKSGQALLEYTGYDMVGVELKGRALVQGRVTTGFGPGYSRATIQTSKNLSPALEVMDESTTNYPYVSLEYLPRSDLGTQLMGGRDSLTAGMRLQLIQHNSFNHKSVSTGEVVMTVKKVQIEREFEMSVEGRRFRVAPGPCYGLLKHDRLVHQFMKEPLDPDSKMNLEREVEALAK